MKIVSLTITAVFLGISLLQTPQALAFAKKPATAAKASPSPAKKYACQMFCAVSDKPGKCPKCGMEMWEVSE